MKRGFTGCGKGTGEAGDRCVKGSGRRACQGEEEAGGRDSGSKCLILGAM